MKIYVLLILISINLFVQHLSAQQISINEIMSSNTFTIKDEDGDYPDWIELYNSGSNDIDLTGYGITDDSTNLFKWVFPSLTLSSKDHLLLFASDKNRTDFIRHWETVIDWGDDWKYILGTAEPPAAWKNLGFNDQSWTVGPSGFGYGDNDDSTIVPTNTNSVYVRKVFNVQDVNDVLAMVLHVDFDDGFVAYLNGIEIARENIGTVGIPPAFNESASNFTEPLIVYGNPPHAFAIQNFQSLLQNGDNVLALQIHNYGTGSSDLTLIPFLSLGLNYVPQNPHGTNPLLSLPNKYLHTNFKLNSEAERIILTNPQNVVIDDKKIGMLGNDISLGRQPDGSENWFIFPQPTPGDSNTTNGYGGFVEPPSLSAVGGFFNIPQTITITPASIDDTIRYTLDGSEPGYSAQVYTAPIYIDSTKVLKIKSYRLGLLPSKTITNTYFINFSTNLTVVSLSTNPGNFFDEEYGIYAMGDSADPNYPYFGANFWKDWERPVHVELFETNGSPGFSIDMGVKIFGNWSRGNAQKSLALFARAQYGYSKLNYRLFDDLPFTEYKSFVLRNAGNDWLSSMMRDGFITSLVDDIDLDKQDYRPAVLFINGKYWGIQNIREKVNEDFLAQHHNINPDSVNILENYGEVSEGNETSYFELYNFIANNSMVIPANYDYVKSKMDIDDFIRYEVTEIYIDNQDWPGNNIKYWNVDNQKKWRWILFDTDFGFGIWDAGAYQNNTLNFATATNGPDWPNPPWSTLMLRQLLNNFNFKFEFINCFADLSNSIFQPAIVLSKLNNMSSVIAPEMTRHIARWQQFDYSTWQSNIQNMRYFASNRLSFMRAHFIQKFNLAGTSLVNLTIPDTSMGRVQLNSIKINTPSWSGVYFIGVPITLIAQPRPGYKFAHWSGSSGLANDTLLIDPQGNLTLTAVFEIDPNYSIPKVVINEINYNSSASFNTEDWIELFNNETNDIDISNWIFKDSDDLHIFTIPEGTVLKADSFIVLCFDTSLFKPHFPDVKNFIGNFGFGLSGNGELIRLYDNQQTLIDSLTYDDTAPWPIAPDGSGSTLSLINPGLENSLAENWKASIGNGTPGKINDIYVSINDNKELIPTQYLLMQNYPNPFNPSTTINYSIPAVSKVIIKVYDVLGNEIKTIVDDVLNPGNYSVNFVAQNLASGVYFYRLQANDFISTKKFILIK